MLLLHYLVLFMTFVNNSSTLWWSLGLPSFQLWSSNDNTDLSLELTKFCSSLQFLTTQQRSYCQTNPKIFSVITRSLRMAVEECQYQFRNQRWNCSLFSQPERIGRLALQKTPETAFIYALTSAAVMHGIAKACARGELNECGCDKSQPKTPSEMKLQYQPSMKIPTTHKTIATSDSFEWGGCSDDLKFGRAISVAFIDRQEATMTRRFVPRLVNLHNNEAGRQVVERSLQLTCKCHGVSGSCTLRVCWQTLPDFRVIGSELRTKYASATHVRYSTQSNVFRPYKTSQKLFNTTDLIHIHAAPSYCEKNLQRGSLGTRGRECNLTSTEPGSCAVLCCDRGYETIISTVEEDCECQFHWCCEVRCKRCVKQVDKHFCK